MEEYKEELERQAKEQKQEPDGVTLATLRRREGGLEYDIVYLVDVNEGCLIKSGIRASLPSSSNGSRAI